MNHIPLNLFWNIDPMTMTKIEQYFRNNPMGQVEHKLNLKPLKNMSESDIDIDDNDKPAMEVNNGIAIIRISGVMSKTRDIFMDIFGGTSIAETIDMFNQCKNDDSIKAVMLLVDSPGGSADGDYELAQSILACKQNKPVYAQVDGYACSAAYYAASQCDKIFVSNPINWIGCIGTIMVLHDVSKMYEDMGVKTIPFTTGEYKATGEPGTSLTENQTKYLQSMIDYYGQDFKTAVANGRKMTIEQVNQIADGRCFNSQDSLKNGLIDGIQSSNDTFNQLYQIVSRNNLAKAKAKIIGMR